MDAQFEGKLLLFRAVLPFLLGLLSQWLFFAGGSPLRGKSQAKASGVWDSVWLFLGCLTIGVAFWVSDFASRGILMEVGQWTAWEAREPWMHWVWMGPLLLTLWVIAYFLFEGRRPKSGEARPSFWRHGGVGMAGGIGLLCWMMFPVSQGYADQIPRFRALGLCAFAASMLNVALLVKREDPNKRPWLAWGYVFQAACVTLVVLQSYASLGEWMVFTASMMIGVLSVGAFCKLSVVGGPLFRLLGFASVAGLCLSQAYAWNTLPIWLLPVLALIPSAIVILDAIAGRWKAGGFWGRLAAFAMVVIVVLALLYFFVLQAEPQW